MLGEETDFEALNCLPSTELGMKHKTLFKHRTRFFVKCLLPHVFIFLTC
jgi:hypothetical protein